MAKDIQNTGQTVNNSFIKGLNKDSDPSYVQEGMWSHARNAVNNTFEGDLGTLSNEAANFLCFTTGSTMPTTGVNAVVTRHIMGAIQMFSDKWLIFTAGHNISGQPRMSEIGLFEENQCTYRPIVQDACLAFDKRYLISGASREKEDCTWQVYWADGLNPDRYLNVGDPQTWPTADYTWVGQTNINYYSNGTQQLLWPGVQWKEKVSNSTDCVFTALLNILDCDHIRLARLVKTPCLKMSLGNQGGTLRNGTYFATIAYTIKGQKVTDYFSPSNTQPIWYPNDLQGSLTIDIEADDSNFEEFVLVVVQNINQGTVAKQIGIYSTKTNRIALDQIKEDTVSVPLRFLPIQTPVIEKSDQMTEVNNYLLRVGPTSKFDFNYQPLANLIKAKWASVEYPADYYVKGGGKGNYLRDEVYTFFIRWVYDTGDKSASYHIPGRAPKQINSTTWEYSQDTTTNALTIDDKIFEVTNTASVDLVPNPLVNTILNDGGKIVGVGDMAYWQSTEEYPDNRPDIWNSSNYCWTGVPIDPITGLPKSSYEYDLCGLNIRHHKFPDNMTDPGNTVVPSVTNHFKTASAYKPNELKIRLMGVYFENISYPKDNDGNDIPGIVGYEILRGSREGNKSIIAKGMLNNFRTYEVQGQVQNNTARTTGLYANYPFNTINGFYNTGTGNDHNRPFMDPYIRIPDTDDGVKYNDKVLDQRVPLDMVSFHSPDTMFNTPFLSSTELKLYGYLRGTSNQQFIEPNKHPQFKLISDLALIPAFLGGLIEAIISMSGKISINAPNYTSAGYAAGAPSPTDPGYLAQLTGAALAQQAYTTFPFVLPAPIIPPIPFAVGYNGALNSYFNSGASFVDAIASAFTGLTPNLTTINNTLAGFMTYPISVGSVSVSGDSYTQTVPDFAYLGPIGFAQAANQLLYYFSEGANVTIDLIRALIPFDQFALQMIAHGFYGDMRKNNATNGLYRFKINDSFYIRDNIQQVPSYQNIQNTGFFNYSINNLKRSDTVVVRTSGGPNVPQSFYQNGVIGPNYITEPTGVSYVDQSLTTLGHIVQNGLVNSSSLNIITTSGVDAPTFDQVDVNFDMPIASHYAGLKVRIRNQYGQLKGIKQITITPCEQKFDYDTLSFQSNVPCDNTYIKIKKIKSTPILFGGDTFVNRYTEKNSMFYFYDWLFGQPDGFEFNYQTHQMIPRPRFFVNSKAFDISELAPSNFSNPTPGAGVLPSRFYRLDYDKYDYETEPNQVNYPGVFRAKEANFYLACSSVRDFFVESDVLVDFRIAGDYEWEKNYNPYNYTSLTRMFDIDPQNITRGNWYRYDYSLSISKLYNQYFSSGNLQSRYYDPEVAKLCYTYYPDRIYYSLQQQDESFKDSWFIYLANNYREFKSQISGVKSINKSGLFITFKNDSPQMFQGVDTLQTDLATKITIGDGGLFSQPGQSVSNADKPYEYGSSQNRLSISNTPAGLFYVSENQGKIFSYGEGLKEISQIGLKWWFNLFLSYKFTVHFPDYPWQDNPVAGIGIQTVYDNTNSILYFAKKDYEVREEYIGKLEYIPLVTVGKTVVNGVTLRKGQGDFFVIKNPDGSINMSARYKLEENAVFKDASWTISYDPKNEFWISFHDWHPDLVIPTKGYFLTTKNNTGWKHNYACDAYCNYYGKNYPFEVEVPVATGQSVTTLKSVEYILECYKRSPNNCVDQFQVLDFNFDKAVVYNMEQVSGYLNLNIFPKNNITLSLQYPKLNNSIIIEPNLPASVGFDILFSKEENKYRFNQFWDITKDRGEFPIGSTYPPTGPLVPGTTELLGNYTQEYLWNTEPNGYVKILNPNNLDAVKVQLQRKKFRNYLNFLYLRKDISGNINMILKLINSKNQISIR
jgi:hypothetical protein